MSDFSALAQALGEPAAQAATVVPSMVATLRQRFGVAPPEVRRRTNGGTALLGGLAAGAGLMYMLDPHRGRRRRALVRDQVASLAARADDAMRATASDVANRTRGIVAEMRALRSRGDVSDGVLAERVRSTLGLVVSQPRAIDVAVSGGGVTLRGPVLEDEVDELIARIATIRGVQSVHNQLEVHAEPAGVPALQGGRRRGESFDFLQRNWAPATRLLVGLGGGALALYALRRRGGLGLIGGAAGTSLLARALTNLETRRLVGAGAGRRAVEVHKTIEIAAPVRDVFEFWCAYENFPRVMSNVREVRDLGNGRSRWTVSGPGGAPVTWEAVITRRVPNELLAWKSVPGSIVANCGVVRFAPTDQRRTRVHIRLSYNPPGGALGHAMAALFGVDPKSAMDDDLMRTKTTLEGGAPPRDAVASGRSV